jgi:hypothetical protein
MCSFNLDNTSIRCNQFAGHHAQRARSLRKDIALHITIVVLDRADETTGGFDSLRDHIVNKPVFIVDSCAFELGLVYEFVDFLEDVFEQAVILHNRVLR